MCLVFVRWCYGQINMSVKIDFVSISILTMKLQYWTNLNSHRKFTASLCVILYRDDNCPNVKKDLEDYINIFHYIPSYWKCWKEGVTAKEMVRGTTEHGYSCLKAFSYMFDPLNFGSNNYITVRKDTHRFMYYYSAFGACIRGIPQWER